MYIRRDNSHSEWLVYLFYWVADWASREFRMHSVMVLQCLYG